MPTTPETYPNQCDCSESELRRLQERFNDEDDPFGEGVYGWPPVDVNDDPYPIFFTPDELTDDGQLKDQNGKKYKPFSGRLTPTDLEDRCNAPLNNWRARYPEIRYCGRAVWDDSTFCYNHRSRIETSNSMTDDTLDTIASAEEMMQTGLFTQTIDHFYNNLDPLKKLFGWGTFESLMGESSYEFAVEYETRKFDFSDAAIRPDGVDSEGILDVKCGFPTENLDPALSLYAAAMMGVQIITVQPRIMYENEDEGQRMMESKTIEHAQLTAPTENSPDQDYKTLETWSEHHLNLPLSRLVRDRPKLLERGGVGVDADESADTISEDDVVLEIQADADEVETTEGGTDPNAFDGGTAPSEEIVDKASDG